MILSTKERSRGAAKHCSQVKGIGLRDEEGCVMLLCGNEKCFLVGKGGKYKGVGKLLMFNLDNMAAFF